MSGDGSQPAVLTPAAVGRTAVQPRNAFFANVRPPLGARQQVPACCVMMYLVLESVCTCATSLSAVLA